MRLPHPQPSAAPWFAIACVVAMLLFAALGVVTKSRGQVPPRPLGVEPTAEMIALGRELFFDTILSQDGTVSCATCHDPAKGWADGMPVAVGIRGQAGTINSPTILNAAHSMQQFRNGRTIGTATQALLPLENPIEMGGPGNEAAAVRRIAATPKYVRLFAGAFGQAPTAQGLAVSIAAFETTVATTDTLANRRAAGERVLSADAEVGYQLFIGRAGCVRCHTPPLWTDRGFHNTGVDVGRLDVDQGRFAVTRRESDRRKWKTPGLIAISTTAPYFHDGRAPTLMDVLRHYRDGGAKRGVVDRRTEILPLGLTDTQLSYIEKFLVEGMAPMEMPK